MDTDRANEIELDRERIIGMWCDAGMPRTLMTWIADNPALDERWNA